ncbi:MAG: Ycf66 family protein [Cyanobacteria bacterium]|nr:Ycf66 family protein [Cyanobacteriota bacterium]
MVNASLNWASIVGIVLAVGGAFLYFMRNFKPALARDYDVFFAAVGLLCGGILFFQGWRLDPILQFGQFLLAGTTVFFAYESVRLRGITTEQARRSSFFDDEEPQPLRSRGGSELGRDWERERDVDRFEDQDSSRRRIPTREEEDDFYRPRRSSRAAIPEQAASRMGERSENWDPEPRRAALNDPRDASRYRPASSARSSGQQFGERRRDRDGQQDIRRGSRPAPATDPAGRSSRRPTPASSPAPAGLSPSGVPEGTPLRGKPKGDNEVSDADFSPLTGTSSPRSRPESPVVPPTASRDSRSSRSPSTRDNSSRFDD